MSQTATSIGQAAAAASDKEGKYLTFALGAEEYGLEILTVREIIGYMSITAVPKTPCHVKGVINLRGQVIPVVDIRTLFGMESREITDETCIIVVEITQNRRTFSTGVIVDKVSEVLDIPGENIEAPPQVGQSLDTDFILGMGKVNNTVKILLNIGKVLNGSELEALDENLIQ